MISRLLKNAAVLISITGGLSEAAFHSTGGVSGVHLAPFENSGSALVGGIAPASPQCWKSAIALFSEFQQIDNKDASIICQNMQEDQQKLLALEIARCHLQDLDKPLLKDSEAIHHCRIANKDLDLKWCLKHLTDAGANAYTHYVSYVQQLCIRLTQERMVSLHYESTNDMANRYADISKVSLEQLELIGELARKHAEQLLFLANVPDQIKDALDGDLRQVVRDTVSQSLEEQMRVQFGEQLDNRLRILLQNQAQQQATMLASILDQVESRDTEQKRQYEGWTAQQRLVWETQVKELDQQRRKMEEHREKMDILSETVSKTTATIQPLLGIQTLVATATQGYNWLAFLLHFLGTFNFVWLITRPKRCNRWRSYLFGLVLVEALLEMGITFLKQENLLTERERVAATIEFRRCATFLEIFVYLFGVLFFPEPRQAEAIPCPPCTPVDVEERMRVERDQFLQRLENTLTGSYRLQMDASQGFRGIRPLVTPQYRMSRAEEEEEYFDALSTDPHLLQVSSQQYVPCASENDHNKSVVSSSSTGPALIVSQCRPSSLEPATPHSESPSHETAVTPDEPAAVQYQTYPVVCSIQITDEKDSKKRPADEEFEPDELPRKKLVKLDT
jgi:hypothetical protein